MSLFGDILGSVLGYNADKKTNKLNKEQLELQKMLANKQISIADYIQELAKQVVSKNYGYSDGAGGGISFDPKTGMYTSTLNPAEKGIQDASYKEELARSTHDQAIRRAGLDDFEAMRKRSVGEAANALGDINLFKQGVGRVDPKTIGSQLRADRTGAVNAGYDDAARAAQTLQLRTGNASLTDALSGLARDRGRAITTTVGSPEVEGLQFADDLNSKRYDQLFDTYKRFGDEGRAFYDAEFQPSTYADDAYSKFTDAMKFDLSKYDLAMGGSGNAASTIGNAATGQQNAYGAFMKNRIANPLGGLVSGIDASIGDAASQLFKMISGMG